MLANLDNEKTIMYVQHAIKQWPNIQTKKNIIVDFATHSFFSNNIVKMPFTLLPISKIKFYYHEQELEYVYAIPPDIKRMLWTGKFSISTNGTPTTITCAFGGGLVLKRILREKTTQDAFFCTEKSIFIDCENCKLRIRVRVPIQSYDNIQDEFDHAPNVIIDAEKCTASDIPTDNESIPIFIFDSPFSQNGNAIVYKNVENIIRIELKYIVPPSLKI